MKPKTTASPPILILGGDAELLGWTARALRDVSARIDTVAALGDDQPIDGAALIVAHYDGLRGRDRRRLFEAVDSGAAPRVLMIATAPDSYQPLARELELHRLTNLLALDRVDGQDELRTAVAKLAGDDIFGLDPYFAVDVARTTARVRRSRDIVRAVTRVRQFASDRKIHPRLIENAVTAADELLTNAVYNAPVDAQGAPRFAHLPRTAAVALEADEHITITLCHDDRRLGLLVSDGFGTLTRSQALDHLALSLRRHHREPHGGKGGAGLGLYMTFDALSHLVLAICPGQRTEALGLIHTGGSFRDFISRGKSFNIFLSDRRS